MVSSSTLQDLERWFLAYTGFFAPGDERRRRAMESKSRHSMRVREEIREISENSGMSPEEVRLAEAVGLLHDVGRFAQVDRYGTLVDSTSINHARLGVRVMRREGILENVDPVERKIILIAVENHNKPELPALLRGRALAHSKLIRDADKLDIFHMLTGIYARGGKSAEEFDFVFFGLPEEETRRGKDGASGGSTPGPASVSETVYRKVVDGEVVPYSELKNLNDFKLLQMGWVFDLNFTFSLRRVRERGFMEKIRDSMPPSEMADEVYARVRTHLEERCT